MVVWSPPPTTSPPPEAEVVSFSEISESVIEPNVPSIATPPPTEAALFPVAWLSLIVVPSILSEPSL